MLGFVALAGLLAVMLAPAAPPDPPPAGRVEVTPVTINGSGCPAGTVSVAPAPDNSGFVIRLSNFQASAGGGAPTTSSRQNCQANLAVRVPAGYTWTIDRVDRSGSVNLAAGATGLVQATHYFQGSQDQATWSHTFTGPLQQDWQLSQVIDPASQVWAPCGEQRNLNVNSELRVSTGADNAVTSTLREREEHFYRFAWKRC
ncbi:DUF4360 domain-containing protein [Pseudonocardiaceae bacterium YIM PH 21723]|nr:DUF4360 domain-containing protein [Pseudonocardiaceae bacterium YIM PH 21723]